MNLPTIAQNGNGFVIVGAEPGLPREQVGPFCFKEQAQLALAKLISSNHWYVTLLRLKEQGCLLNGEPII